MFFKSSINSKQTLSRWNNLPGSSLPIAISTLASTLDQPLVIITNTVLEAMNLQKSLIFFKSKTSTYDIIVFPDRETLPYDQLSPHKDITSERLKILNDLQIKSEYICIISSNTLMNHLPTQKYLQQNTFSLTVGQDINLSSFKLNLEIIGYYHVNQVMEHGEYCIKGGILDIFPMGHHTPFRLELFGDTVDTIRVFNPETQLSIEKVDSINLMPATEYPLDQNCVKEFQARWHENFDMNPKLCPIYQSINELRATPGAEYYLSLFFNQPANFFDHMQANTLVMQYPDIYNTCHAYMQQVHERFEQVNFNNHRSVVSPSDAFVNIETLFAELKKFSNIKILKDNVKSSDSIDFNSMSLAKFNIDVHQPYPMEPLKDFIQNSQNRILIVADSLGRQEIILSLLKTSEIEPNIVQDWDGFIACNSKLNICTGIIEHGTIIEDFTTTIISEFELFGFQSHSHPNRSGKTIDSKFIIKNLVELDIGALVTHVEYGIAKYQGLQNISTTDQMTEFLALEYYDNAMIYVPVTSLNLISRYNGVNTDKITLSKLGSKQWKNARELAIKQLRDVAAELLDIYALRQNQIGTKLIINHSDYLKFCSKFDFDETTDQTKAFADVVNDLTSNKIMDRLICGDVGFGKTEVSMRAAYIVAKNNLQIAILVPTTILANQHYQTFVDRFSGFNINIDCISRFKSALEKTVIIKKIKSGELDIIIGTHSLLNEKVEFKNLGLLVIDEEHRFGVKQKEVIKSRRNNVDILSMTATPIPRTLNMSLNGVRDISILATAPASRLAIKTFILQKSDSSVREGIMRELLRGGQIFYLDNSIKSISATLNYLNELVPEAKVKIAHGSTPEKELEKIMSDFYHGVFNILLCTTIVETGLDIPSANTIIIERADQFGLAQLYQLRGRVGRSHHQSYAYLLLPDQKLMTSDAKKRIDAFKTLNKLGSGFTLASYDMDIRGAGEILGKEQSGNIQKIGFSLYSELLEQTVQSLKDGKLDSSPLRMYQECEINLNITSLIPTEYIFSVKDRLVMYKRISSAKNQVDLDNIQVELIDRFGLLPEALKCLFKLSSAKITALSCDIEKINLHVKGGYVLFNDSPNIDHDATLKLVTLSPKLFKLMGPTKLSIKAELNTIEERFSMLERLFATFKKRA